MDDLGGRTEEFITLRQPHPAEPSDCPGLPTREADNRRYGRRLLIGGASLLFGTTLVVAALPERVVDAMPPLVAMTLIHDCLLLGTAGILASLLEMLSRYNRHLAREALARDAERDQKMDILLGLVAPLPGRLTAVEGGLQALVSVLPDEMQRREWLGFNDAVREGFSGGAKATGTDGSGKRRPHLGLIHGDDEDSAEA